MRVHLGKLCSLEGEDPAVAQARLFLETWASMVVLACLEVSVGYLRAHRNSLLQDRERA